MLPPLTLLFDFDCTLFLFGFHSYITKSHRAAFLPVFQSVISPFFMALLAPTNPVSLRVNALCR
jgi:hypothetical protein